MPVPKTMCQYCEDVAEREYCSVCHKVLIKICLACHNELFHNAIENQNFNIGGNRRCSLNSVDKDHDAYN